MYGIRIILITSYNVGFVISIDPVLTMGTRLLYLSFWAEVHYNSIYPCKDPPRHAPDVPDEKPKKLLGSRRLGRFVSDVSEALAY